MDDHFASETHGDLGIPASAAKVATFSLRIEALQLEETGPYAHT